MAIVLFIVIVGGAILISKWRGKSLDYQNQQIIAEAQTEKLYKDSDNDGLKDWEEELWGTDLNNPDTNSDGIKDAEEIRLGINPVGKGPDDKLATGTIQKKVNPSIEADLTETNKFSRELFTKYVIVAGKNGSPATASDYTALLYDYIQNAEQGEITIYKETDFKKTDTTNESLRAYGNAFGKIVKEAEQKYPGSELSILDVAVKNGESKEITELEKPAARYANVRDNLLLLKVPEGLLPIHTKIVNLLDIMTISVSNMRYTLSDPIKAMGGMSMYPDTVDLLITASEELSDYFISQGIIFKKTEDGYNITSGK